jgi:anti-sigma factor ChrR (cupin superfamily)
LKAHVELTPELYERAERYALGEMDGEEARAFELHQQDCGPCRRATADLVRCVEGVLELAPVLEPPADLWERVRERISANGKPLAHPSAAGAASPGARDLSVGIHFQPAAEAAWLDTLIPGLQVRPVWVDEVNQRASAMARLAPGTIFPAHVHEGLEECIVLSGDLWVGDELMGPGDYQVARAGSHHAVQRTEHGCTIYIAGTKGQLEAVLPR